MTSLAALIVAASMFAVDAPPDVTPDDLSRLSGAIAKALASERRVESVVDIRWWAPTPENPAPDVARDQPTGTTSALVRILGRRHAVVWPEGATDIEVTFDGVAYSYSTTSEPSLLDLRNAAHVGHALLFQTTSLRLLPGTASMEEVVRTSIPLSLRREGDIWTYRFVNRAEALELEETRKQLVAAGVDTGPQTQAAFTHEVVVDLGDPPRLLGVATEYTVGEEKRVVRSAFTVTEWHHVAGAMTPRRVLSTYLRSNGTTSSQIYESREITELPALGAQAKDTRPFPTGTRVSSNSGTFRFTVGSPHIVFEGQRLTLEEPLWVHPGERLGELVKSAKPE
ncbi:MAG: hypothetical protein JNM94_08330 [Phycisphaerae bacterium]|nr:hypothetical protein [Phycisphaerae bacterium]